MVTPTEKTTTRENNMNDKIQLQSIGLVNAKPAGELVSGDVTIWNFGSTAIVLEKVKETAAFVTLSLDNGKHGISERRLKKTRLVGFRA